MKALSANIAAGIAANSTPQFLIEVESATTLYRWATFPCNPANVSGWTGPDFEGKIAKNGFGKIRRAVDIREGGNVSQAQRWTFKIPNQSLISDTLATENFIGRRAEIRLIFTDQTGPSWMNALPVAPKSVIEDVTWDESHVTFYCSDSWIKQHRILPKRMLTPDEFPELPESNRNKVVPILYGNWLLNSGAGINKTGVASNLSPGASSIVYHDYFLGILNQPLKYGDVGTGANRPRSILCGHDVLQRSYPTPDGKLTRWVDEREIFCLTNIRHVQPAFGAVIDGVTADEVFKASNTLFRTTHLIPVVDVVGTSGATNPEYAVDTNDTNFTVLDANGEVVSYEIVATVGKTGTTAENVDWKFRIDAVNRVNDKVQYQISKNGTVHISWTDVPAYGSFVTVDIATKASPALDSGEGSYAGYQIEFRFVDVSGHDAGCEFRIKSVYVHVDELDDENVDVLMQTGKGRKFGEWIDSPKHSNSFNEGDLIENPAFVIESVLCDELGLKPRLHGAAIQTQDDSVTSPFFQVLHDSSLALDGIVSIECWVKFISFVSAGENFIVAKINGSGNIAPYALSVSTGGKVRFWRGDGSTSNYLESVATLSTGVWYHIVATAAGGSGATRYIHINGVVDNGSSIIQAVADGGSVLRIGLRAGSSTRTNMILDELRVWNRVISEGEAKQLYNGGSGYPKPFYPGNTKTWWRFDEEGRRETDGSTPSGAFTVSDSSGNGNDASSNNHTSMRWVTGASAKVPYSESEVQENDVTVAHPPAGFDVLAGKRSSWKFARQYLDKSSSLDMIRELCRDAHMAYFVNYLGESTIARIDAGESGENPTILSKFRLNGDKTSFSVKRGDLKYWYNEFVLRYKINMATGEPEESLFVSSPDAESFDSGFTNLSSEGSTYWGLCRDAHFATLQVNRWEYTATNIRDAATAEFLLKAIIKHLTRRPLIVQFKTGLGLIGYEPLELARLSHDLLPAAVNATSRFRLIEQELDPNSCEITSTFFEVGIP